MKALVLMGPPGVGKGTQAERLREALSLAHLSTGEILRQAVREGSPLGRRVKTVMESGGLVSDDLIGEVVDAAIGATQGEGVLLDGFPRTLPQVGILDGILERRRVALQAVVLIDAPREILMRRLTGRRVCPACGAVFHIDSRPPAKEGACDGCGTAVVQRPDDGEEVVAERLRVYREQTAPLIAAYRGRGVLREVDGTGSPDAVFHAIEAALDGGRP